MNWLAVLLALTITALPVQAGACPMDQPADPSPTPMADHAGGGHDCCPDTAPDQNDSESPCGGDTHCGQCVVPGSALPAQIAAVAVERPEIPRAARVGDVSPSHQLPPYRPPIS
ncbi:MAG: hypothetical protein P8Y54_08685 [Xanthomonadales bacterium]|jgi:hypothetical protein